MLKALSTQVGTAAVPLILHGNKAFAFAGFSELFNELSASQVATKPSPNTDPGLAGSANLTLKLPVIEAQGIGVATITASVPKDANSEIGGFQSAQSHSLAGASQLPEKLKVKPENVHASSLLDDQATESRQPLLPAIKPLTSFSSAVAVEADAISVLERPTTEFPLEALVIPTSSAPIQFVEELNPDQVHWFDVLQTSNDTSDYAASIFPGDAKPTTDDLLAIHVEAADLISIPQPIVLESAVSESIVSKPDLPSENSTTKFEIAPSSLPGFIAQTPLKATHRPEPKAPLASKQNLVLDEKAIRATSVEHKSPRHPFQVNSPLVPHYRITHDVQGSDKAQPPALLHAPFEQRANTLATTQLHQSAQINETRPRSQSAVPTRTSSEEMVFSFGKTRATVDLSKPDPGKKTGISPVSQSIPVPERTDRLFAAGELTVRSRNAAAVSLASDTQGNIESSSAGVASGSVITRSLQSSGTQAVLNQMVVPLSSNVQLVQVVTPPSPFDSARAVLPSPKHAVRATPTNPFEALHAVQPRPIDAMHATRPDPSDAVRVLLPSPIDKARALLTSTSDAARVLPSVSAVLAVGAATVTTASLERPESFNANSSVSEMGLATLGDNSGIFRQGNPEFAGTGLRDVSTTKLTAKPFAEAIIAQVKSVDSSEGRTLVNLHPRGLGALSIEVVSEQDLGAKIVVRAENPVVLQALRDDRHVLAQSLGLNGGDSFEFHENAHHQGRAGSDKEQQRGKNQTADFDVTQNIANLGTSTIYSGHLDLLT